MPQLIYCECGKTVSISIYAKHIKTGNHLKRIHRKNITKRGCTKVRREALKQNTETCYWSDNELHFDIKECV